MLADRLRDERMSRITGVLNSHHAALVDEVVDLLANDDEWCGPGVWTIESYLQWRTGVSLATARQLSTIARRVDDLPVSIEAFRRGELTLDQMAAIAHSAPGWVDAEVLQHGKTLTVNQLNRVLRDYPFPTFGDDGNEVPPAGLEDIPAGSEVVTDHSTSTPAAENTSDTATDPQVDEYCSYTYGEDGMFRLHLATDFETGNIIKSAMDEAHDRLFQEGQQTITLVDAIRKLAESSLDTVADAARASRFKPSIFLDTDASATDVAGWNVPDAIRRHLTCDGLLSPVFVEAGVPISVGRTQRIVPERTRRLIERRDSCRCCIPGCNRSIGLHVHHIIHWEDGGLTITSNLVLICSHHHRQLHRGLIGISGNADLPARSAGALEFTDRAGRRILPSGATPIIPTGPIPPSAVPYQHPLGQRLHPGAVHFTPPRPPAPPTTPAPSVTTSPTSPTSPSANRARRDVA